MGFFSNMYTKEGPGVRKDQPPKKGIPRFFEILMRDYGHLLKVNFLFLLCCLPMVSIWACCSLRPCCICCVRCWWARP